MIGPRRPGLPTCGSAEATLLTRFVLPFTVSVLLWASPAQSHDPSAWGGLFRSRDHGAAWVSANTGAFVSGAIALTISPTDTNHLLLGAESGLLRSRNGGRDWTIEAPSVVLGSVFAVAFSADGQRALASTGLAVFRNESENNWRPVSAPQGTAPARAMVRGVADDRVYLAGWAGLFRSDDGGGSWSSAADGLPEKPATALLVVRGSSEVLYAIVRGGIWASADGARTWASRGEGISPTNVDALAVDAKHRARLWAAGGDRMFQSDDGGASWQGVGRPLPEPNTTVHGIAASEEMIIVTTDRGLYRSVDGGKSWTAIIDNIPAHLGAGPLVRDPLDPATLYAGFALVPYSELWRRAADREGALAQVSIASLAGGAILLLLVALGAVAALRRLERYYRPPTRSALATPAPGHHRMGKTLP